MDAQKVILALSGGVDSAVAAHLLKRVGCEVVGVHLRMFVPHGCDPAEDARAVARQVGIDFELIDVTGPFRQIVDYFASEYAGGRTPNPCGMCNPAIKFRALLDYADAHGADLVATGHHARIIERDGRAAIARARSRAKDQSYILFGLERQSLSRLRFPIGELAGKDEVRRIAAELGFSVAGKRDSLEICFVPDDDYAAFLRPIVPEAFCPGEILDQAGNVLGRHEGVGKFTIGQRRGLRVAAGMPMYVTGIDAAAATVTIGPRAQAEGTRLVATGANWHADVGDKPFAATVQVRYNHAGAPAEVRATAEGGFEARFDTPIHAITPGQVAVVYDGDCLLGGGWIDRAG